MQQTTDSNTSVDPQHPIDTAPAVTCFELKSARDLHVTSSEPYILVSVCGAKALLVSFSSGDFAAPFMLQRGD